MGNEERVDSEVYRSEWRTREPHWFGLLESMTVSRKVQEIPDSHLND